MKNIEKLSFVEAWKALNEGLQTSYIYDLDQDPDYGKTDPEYSFLDTLLKLREEYLAAKTDEEQDAAMDALHQKLINFLSGSKWKIILRISYSRYGSKYMVVTGEGFVLDVLFMVLEPTADIVYASVLLDVNDLGDI